MAFLKRVFKALSAYTASTEASKSQVLHEWEVTSAGTVACRRCGRVLDKCEAQRGAWVADQSHVAQSDATFGHTMKSLMSYSACNAAVYKVARAKWPAAMSRHIIGSV